MEWLIYIACFLLGLGVAFIITWLLASKPDALLNVDMRDKEKDFYDFVFLIPTTEVPKKKSIKVEIHTKE